MPRVLVGIPTYNRPVLVQQTVRSVLAQTFSDLRVVISDNGSKPGVADQIASFVAALKDSRVSFHRQSENRGEYGQGRFLFGCLADEDYFLMVHDDDMIAPGYVEKAVAKLDADASPAYFTANLIIIDDDGKSYDDLTLRYRKYWRRVNRPDGPFNVLDTHMESGFTFVSGCCFRAAALRDSGFVDEGLSGNFPFESNIFLRLGEKGASGWYCSEPLIHIRVHRQNLGHHHFLNVPHVVETTMKLYEPRQFTGLNERRRREVLGKLYRVNSIHRARRGEHREARVDMVRSLRYNPRSISSWVMAPLAMMSPRLMAAVITPPRGMIEGSTPPSGTLKGERK